MGLFSESILHVSINNTFNNSHGLVLDRFCEISKFPFPFLKGRTKMFGIQLCCSFSRSLRWISSAPYMCCIYRKILIVGKNQHSYHTPPWRQWERKPPFNRKYDVRPEQSSLPLVVGWFWKRHSFIHCFADLNFIKHSANCPPLYTEHCLYMGPL